MRIAVCVKIVLANEESVEQLEHSRMIYPDRVSISEHDLLALEFASDLARATSSELCALSSGPSRLLSITRLQKEILARGAHSLYLFFDDAVKEQSSFSTALYLSRCIREIGDIDLIICGDSAEDTIAGQTGVQLAELMDYPVLNNVRSCSINDFSLELLCEDLEYEDLYKVHCPAVVCISSDCAKPRICSVTDIFGSAKKPVRVLDAESFHPGPKKEIAQKQTTIYRAPNHKRGGKIISGVQSPVVFSSELYTALEKVQ